MVMELNFKSLEDKEEPEDVNPDIIIERYMTEITTYPDGQKWVRSFFLGSKGKTKKRARKKKQMTLEEAEEEII